MKYLVLLVSVFLMLGCLGEDVIFPGSDEKIDDIEQIDVSQDYEPEDFATPELYDEYVQERIDEGYPVISSIIGNGSDGEHFKDGLIVMGYNFDDTTEVYLDDIYTTTTFDSENQVVVELPVDITEKIYVLKLQTAKGEVSDDVYILQGEQGETGAKIEKKWECASGYIDSLGIWEFDIENCQIDSGYVTFGFSGGTIYKYTDGSYEVDWGYSKYDLNCTAEKSADSSRYVIRTERDFYDVEKFPADSEEVAVDGYAVLKDGNFYLAYYFGEEKFVGVTFWENEDVEFTCNQVYPVQ